MNIAAVIHQPTNAFVLPVSRNQLDFRIRTARDDVLSIELYYWNRIMTYPERMENTAMRQVYRDGLHDEWRLSLDLPGGVRSLDYFFRLTDRDGAVWYAHDNGVTETPPRDGFYEFVYSDPEDYFEVPEWAEGAVWYQIFPDRFAVGHPEKNGHEYAAPESLPTLDSWYGGDLKGIIDHLDDLAAFGAEILYLNPVFKGMFVHKYAETDYFEVDPDFGTLEELKELVNGAHQRGMRVVLDGVFNHTGENFAAFRDLWEKGENSAYKNWYIYDSLPLRYDPLNYRCFESFGFMPKLRTTDPEVRAFIIRVMNYWIETAGIDGWRLDVADELERGTWGAIRIAIKQKHPQALLMAETWCDANPLIRDGHGVDCAMNYLFLFAVREWIAKRNIDAAEFDNRINRMLSRYPDAVNRIQFNLLDSHDTKRFLNECGEDKARLKLAAAFQMLFLGAPSVYYGDEIGLTGGWDPDCRRMMIWDEARQDRNLYEWYHRLIRIREESSAIRKGSYRTMIADNNVFSFERKYGSETITVAFNNCDEDITVELPLKGAEDLLSHEILKNNVVILHKMDFKVFRSYCSAK